MDAAKTNTKLRKMYNKFLNKFDKDIDIHGYKTPMLMQCGESYADDNNIRILFVDTVSQNWNYKDDCYNDTNGYDVDKIISKYPQYCWNSDNIYKSKFFDWVNKINRSLNPGKSCNFLCTSLFKFNSPTAKPLRDGKSVDGLEYNYNILCNEINAVKPDFVFFVTGKKYDYCLPKVLGEVCYPAKVMEEPSIAQIRCFGKRLPFATYRLPLTNGKDYISDSNVISTAVNLVIYTDLSLYGNLLKESALAEL